MHSAFGLLQGLSLPVITVMKLLKAASQGMYTPAHYN